MTYDMTHDIDYLYNAQERIKLALDMRRTSEDAQAIAQIAIAEALIAIAEQLRDRQRSRTGRWLTVDDAAELVNIHAQTVRRAIADGDLVASKVGATYRIHPSAVDAWLDSNTTIERAGAELVPDEPPC